MACFNVAPPVKTLDEAHEKFILLCQENHQLDVKLFPLKNTLWVYIPLKQRIIDSKTSPEGPSESDQSTESYKVLYLKTQFKDKQFQTQYDIQQQRGYGKSYGFDTIYTQYFMKTQQAVQTTLKRVYTDLEIVPGDVDYLGKKKQETHKKLVESYVKTDKAPDFMVVVYADINTGIELETISYFEDVVRAISEIPSITPEELQGRTISELRGQTDIIDNKEGTHLKPYEMTLPIFLAKQIDNRINIKFNPQNTPPSGETHNEFFGIIREVLAAYQFFDFDTVTLYNLYLEKTYQTSREKLDIPVQPHTRHGRTAGQDRYNFRTRPQFGL